AGSNLNRQMQFDIRASDLRSGISQFSQATGLQVVVNPATVAGRRTGGVQGAYSVGKALDQLLKGTNLTAQMRGGVAVLKPASSPARVAIAAPARYAAITQDIPAPATAGAEPLSGDIVVTGD